jgi:hypothetical protein
MVSVDLILLDSETVRLFGKAGECTSHFLRHFCQRPGRIDTDDFHPPRLRKAVKQHVQRSGGVRH